MRNKIYFLSDVHLGSDFHNHKKSSDANSMTLPNTKLSKNNYNPNHDIERKLCRWLEMVRIDAKTIYLLGDIFDYWFEYKNVVPRGFTRFLGKISEMTDEGIEIHFFIGNHDIWVTDYLQKECSMIVHTKPMVVDIMGKKFFLAHGDGIGDKSKGFKILRKIFHNKYCRIAFAGIHPRWTISFGQSWSNSRDKHGTKEYMGERDEYLILFAKEHLQIAPNINYFVFGHRHIMLDLMLSASSRIVILGDWIQYFSYAVFDGSTMNLEIFEEEGKI